MACPVHNTLRLRSLAKINLDLRVLDKRPDGYHNLRTVFQTISLADTIDIDYAPARRLSIDIASNLPIPGNLIETALQLLAIPGRFKIKLTKRIPLGGGLGGGSSNAAAILLAIPQLTSKPVKFAKLLDFAARLGSDVPFFLLGGTAIGLARGTEIHPLPPLNPYPAILVTPGIHVSTAAAYRALNRPASLPAAPAATPITHLLDAPPDRWRCRNDFEPVVFPLHPQLKSIKGKLKKLGADVALMSGSGSTLFGIFTRRESRDAALLSLRRDLGSDKIFPVSLVSRRAYQSLWRKQLSVPLDSKTWPPQSPFAQ